MGNIIVGNLDDLKEYWITLSQELDSVTYVRELIMSDPKGREGAEILSPNIKPEYLGLIMGALYVNAEAVKQEMASYEHEIVRQTLVREGKLEIPLF